MRFKTKQVYSLYTLGILRPLILPRSVLYIGRRIFVADWLNRLRMCQLCIAWYVCITTVTPLSKCEVSFWAFTPGRLCPYCNVAACSRPPARLEVRSLVRRVEHHLVPRLRQ